MIAVKKSDLACSLVLIVSSIFLYIRTYYFRKVACFSIGPTMFPRTILLFLIILSVALAFQAISFKKEETTDSVSKSPADRANKLLQMEFIGLTLAYVISLYFIGYLAGTTAFLFFGMLLLGHRNVRSTMTYLGISFAAAVAAKYIFQTLMKLFLP